MQFGRKKTSWRDIGNYITSPFSNKLTSYIKCKNRHLDLKQKYKEGKTVLCTNAVCSLGSEGH